MPDTRPDARIDRLAGNQHGLVDRAQARSRGLSRQHMSTRAGRGSLRRVNTGVYRTMGSAATWEQQLLAACLAAGPAALASHRAAAVLWGLMPRPAPVEISVPCDHRPRPSDTVVHRSTDLRPVDRSVRRRIPVTNPIRTLGDLGAVAPDLVPPAVERGLMLDLLPLAALWRLLDELARPGRRGLGVLRQALEQRVLGTARSTSALEPVFAAVAADAGLGLAYQHRVTVDGQTYVLDLALPDVLVGIEIDGLETHATLAALDHDLARQNRLVVTGWHLLRYSATHLVRRRTAIRREVLDLVARRRGA